MQAPNKSHLQDSFIDYSEIEQQSKTFGNINFDPEHEKQIRAFLGQKLVQQDVSYRPGPNGVKLAYVESRKAISISNEAFGFNGWSCRILELKEEYRTNKGDQNRPKWSVAYSSRVRVQLKDGTAHEDVGFGQSDGQKDLGQALENAQKSSISDARKRALRLFGEYLGNSVYDRAHLRQLRRNPKGIAPAAPMAFPGNIPVDKTNSRNGTNSRDLPYQQIKTEAAPAPQRNSKASSSNSVVPRETPVSNAKNNLIDPQGPSKAKSCINNTSLPHATSVSAGLSSARENHSRSNNPAPGTRHVSYNHPPLQPLRQEHLNQSASSTVYQSGSSINYEEQRKLTNAQMNEGPSKINQIGFDTADLSLSQFDFDPENAPSPILPNCPSAKKPRRMY